jgi:hypothetical protein
VISFMFTCYINLRFVVFFHVSLPTKGGCGLNNDLDTCLSLAF